MCFSKGHAVALGEWTTCEGMLSRAEPSSVILPPATCTQVKIQDPAEAQPARVATNAVQAVLANTELCFLREKGMVHFCVSFN